MHEDLLGYLLGALDPDEMQRVSQRLREDPEARGQLVELERLMRPLEDGYVPVEPPRSDLVARTLAMLPPGPPVPEQRHGSETPGSDLPFQVTDVPESESLQRSLGLASMHAAVDSGRDASYSWFDWVGGATAAAVVLALLLPALAQGRFEARKTACQDQLRQFGTALTQFVTRTPQERLPAVSESGPEAFAGVYAVRLKQYGLMDDPTLRWCPSFDVPSEKEATLTNLGEIVSVEDLHNASVDRLQQIQRYAGGHYAYNLGVVENDHLASPRFEARSAFAVMSDAPMNGVASEKGFADRVGHSGIGINVLFEDGRVQFVPLSALDELIDHPLLNHRGEVEAGVNIDDASLAPSSRPPFIGVMQR